MIYEIHMLKNYPATNLNRDDSGAPKTCQFGGCQRGRISSQCLKRSWRTSELFGGFSQLGVRSRNLPDQVAKELKARGMAEDMAEAARLKVTGIANKDGKEDPKALITSQIVFYCDADVKAIADEIEKATASCATAKDIAKLKAGDIAKAVQKVKARPITLDIALFGRMVTSDAFQNVEAAMQVAHAVSTHAVVMESDYFTAVDDLIAMGDSDDSGAGMIGDIDYNSCCYYEYAMLDMEQLKANLASAPEVLDKLDELLPVLLRVMAMSNPSGKQNTFAGHVCPDLILVEAKDEPIPLSYANAFAKPVDTRKCRVAEDSVEKLADEIDLMDKTYALPVRHRAWMSPRSERKPEKCEAYDSFPALAEACAQWAKG